MSEEQQAGGYLSEFIGRPIEVYKITRDGMDRVLHIYLTDGYRIDIHSSLDISKSGIFPVLHISRGVWAEIPDKEGA